MIYFDNGATSFPKPAMVKNAADEYFYKYGGNPGRGGYSLSVKTAEKIFEVRTKLKNMFKTANEENIIFTYNCTDSCNMVINGYLKKGDHAVISDMEHNAVARPVYRLAKEGIITYDVAETFENENLTVESIKTKIRPNTKLVITTHASNVLGKVLPIEKIGKACHDNDILYMVDAAQSGGLLPIDMKKCCIDFLCLAGHKSLLGTTGVGVLITDKGELLKPARVGGTGSMSFSLDYPDFTPDRLECGTVNTLGIMCLGAGLDYINKVGMNRIYEHEMKLAQNLYDIISRNKNIIIYSEYPNLGEAMPMITFNVKGIYSEELCAKLGEKGFCLRGGLHCSPLAHKKAGTSDYGAVRAVFGCFNNNDEVLKLGKLLEKN